MCLRLKITAWSANDAFADAMSFMKNHASTAVMAIHGTQMNAAFCAQMVTV